MIAIKPDRRTNMKLRHTIYANTVLFAVLTQFTALAHAEGGQNNGRRGPPQVAIDACSGSVAGDSCSFTGRDSNEMSGTCFAPQERELACKPEGHDGRQGKGQHGNQ
jgi:hypothetical protein